MTSAGSAYVNYGDSLSVSYGTGSSGKIAPPKTVPQKTSIDCSIVLSDCNAPNSSRNHQMVTKLPSFASALAHTNGFARKLADNCASRLAPPGGMTTQRARGGSGMEKVGEAKRL
jgi:hypothetical protein